MRLFPFNQPLKFPSFPYPSSKSLKKTFLPNYEAVYHVPNPAKRIDLRKNIAGIKLLLRVTGADTAGQAAGRVVQTGADSAAVIADRAVDTAGDVVLPGAGLALDAAGDAADVAVESAADIPPIKLIQG